MVKLQITENTSDHALVALSGELDTAAVDQFRYDLTPLTEDAGKEIIIDFSQLEYISSAGMRILLSLNKQAVMGGGKVVVTGMSESIRQIFQMTGIDQLLTIK